VTGDERGVGAGTAADPDSLRGVSVAAVTCGPQPQDPEGR